MARSANVPTTRDIRVSPPLVKESTVTPISESLEFPSNVVPASSTAALEPNEEWVNAMVDGPDHEITDGAVNANPGSIFVHGASYAADDATELTVIGSERVSSSPNDVVVAFLLEKKQILSHAIRPKPNGFPLGTLSIAGQAFVGLMGLLSLPGARIVLPCLALKLS
ncbi:hypothetical protein Tco_1527207, partial [Tanacetum coccineum]